MSRYITFVVVAAIAGGCASQKNQPVPQKENIRLFDKNHEQVSADRDFGQLFHAAALESWGKYRMAAQLYLQLYNKTKKRLFLRKAVVALADAQEHDRIIKILQKEISKGVKDAKLFSLLATAYFAKEEFDKAIRAAKEALVLEKNPLYYKFIGAVYAKKDQPKKALEYFKRAYAIDRSPSTLRAITYLLARSFGSPQKAIAQIETHIRLYGCDESLCHTLATLYQAQKDFDGLVLTYERLYEATKKEDYLKKLLTLSLAANSYDKAAKYAKMLGDDELLLQILVAQKRFEDAETLALELYRRTKDPRFLAQSAIYLYEGAKKSQKRALAFEVARRLEKAIKEVDDPLFLNYLGYLYIDHGIDVSRGVELVKKALQKEPDSPYYLDSLAWGYYKLKRCKEAHRLIRKVYDEMGLKEEEVREHLEKIEQCQKERNDTR
jgi:tetratricopeptide (TPR) repeat protein